MAQPERTKDEFFAELEDLGEPEVKARFTQGHFGSQKWRWVKAWLVIKDQERIDESNQTARSAKNAAWIAAIAAIIAAISAIISFLINWGVCYAKSYSQPTQKYERQCRRRRQRCGVDLR